MAETAGAAPSINALGIGSSYEALILRHVEASESFEKQGLSSLCREVQALTAELHASLSRPGAQGGAVAADAEQPEASDCSGNGAGRRDGTSTAAVLRERLLLPGQQLCQQHASGTPRLCVEAVAQLLLRLCMFTLPCAEGASELCKKDKRDLRTLVEVLLQELQPMPEGMRTFFQTHIRPVFGANAAVRFIAKAAGVPWAAYNAAPAGKQIAVSQARPSAPAASSLAAADGDAAEASGAATGSGVTAGEGAGADTATQRQLLTRKNRTKSASQAPLPRVRLASKAIAGRAGQQASRQGSLHPGVRVLLPKRSSKPSGLQRSSSAMPARQSRNLDASEAVSSFKMADEVPDSGTGPYRQRPAKALPKPQRLTFVFGGMAGVQPQEDSNDAAGDRLPALPEPSWLQPVAMRPMPSSRPVPQAPPAEEGEADDDWIPVGLCTPDAALAPGGDGSAERLKRSTSRGALPTQRPPLASIQGSPAVSDALCSPGRHRGWLAASLACAQAAGALPAAGSPPASLLSPPQHPQRLRDAASTPDQPARRTLFPPGAGLRSPLGRGRRSPAAAAAAATAAGSHEGNHLLVAPSPAAAAATSPRNVAASPAPAAAAAASPAQPHRTPQPQCATPAAIVSPFALVSSQLSPPGGGARLQAWGNEAILASPGAHADGNHSPDPPSKKARPAQQPQALPAGIAAAAAFSRPSSPSRADSASLTPQPGAVPAEHEAARNSARTTLVLSPQKRAAPGSGSAAAVAGLCEAAGQAGGKPAHAAPAAAQQCGTQASAQRAKGTSKAARLAEQARLNKLNHRQHDLGCPRCRFSMNGCRSCRQARASWLQAQGLDHTQDAQLMAMRAHLQLGPDEIMRGVHVAVAPHTDAEPAVRKRQLPAAPDAAASRRGDGGGLAAQCAAGAAPAGRKRRASPAPIARLPRRRAPAVQLATADPPAADASDGTATAPAAAQPAASEIQAPEACAAPLTTADSAGRLAEPTEGLQRSGLQPAAPSRSATADPPSPAVEPRSRSVTLELPSPGESPPEAAPTPQPARPAAADGVQCQLPPPTSPAKPGAAQPPLQQQQQPVTQPPSGQQAATPAAAAKESGVDMPATAAQAVAAKPPMVTPTTELPPLHDVHEPTADACALSEPAVGAHFWAPEAAVPAEDAASADPAAARWPADELLPAEAAGAAAAAPTEAAPPAASPAVASLLPLPRRPFSASLDATISGLGVAAGAAAKPGALPAPLPPATVPSPAAPEPADAPTAWQVMGSVDPCGTAGSEQRQPQQPAPQQVSLPAAVQHTPPQPLTFVASLRGSLSGALSRGISAAGRPPPPAASTDASSSDGSSAADTQPEPLQPTWGTADARGDSPAEAGAVPAPLPQQQAMAAADLWKCSSEDEAEAVSSPAAAAAQPDGKGSITAADTAAPPLPQPQSPEPTTSPPEPAWLPASGLAAAAAAQRPADALQPPASLRQASEASPLVPDAQLSPDSATGPPQQPPGRKFGGKVRAKPSEARRRRKRFTRQAKAAQAKAAAAAAAAGEALPNPAEAAAAAPAQVATPAPPAQTRPPGAAVPAGLRDEWPRREHRLPEPYIAEPSSDHNRRRQAGAATKAATAAAATAARTPLPAAAGPSKDQQATTGAQRNTKRRHRPRQLFTAESSCEHNRRRAAEQTAQKRSRQHDEAPTPSKRLSTAGRSGTPDQWRRCRSLNSHIRFDD